MNAGTGRQTVRDVNPDAVTLDGFDRRTVNMAVISPTMGFQSGRELMLDRLGNEMKYFYPINNFPWQRTPSTIFHGSETLFGVMTGV